MEAFCFFTGCSGKISNGCVEKGLELAGEPETWALPQEIEERFLHHVEGGVAVACETHREIYNPIPITPI